jgi:hypothetical protein
MAPEKTSVLKHPTSVTVECYSGYTYAEYPIAFVWEGKRHQVERISKRWRTPDGKAFQVLTSTDIQCILTHHEIGDAWTMLLL